MNLHFRGLTSVPNLYQAPWVIQIKWKNIWLKINFHTFENFIGIWSNRWIWNQNGMIGHCKSLSMRESKSKVKFKFNSIRLISHLPGLINRVVLSPLPLIAVLVNLETSWINSYYQTSKVSFEFFFWLIIDRNALFHIIRLAYWHESLIVRSVFGRPCHLSLFMSHESCVIVDCCWPFNWFRAVIKFFFTAAIILRFDFRAVAKTFGPFNCYGPTFPSSFFSETAEAAFRDIFPYNTSQFGSSFPPI